MPILPSETRFCQVNTLNEGFWSGEQQILSGGLMMSLWVKFMNRNSVKSSDVICCAQTEAERGQLHDLDQR